MHIILLSLSCVGIYNFLFVFAYEILGRTGSRLSWAHRPPMFRDQVNRGAKKKLNLNFSHLLLERRTRTNHSVRFAAAGAQ